MFSSIIRIMKLYQKNPQKVTKLGSSQRWESQMRGKQCKIQRQISSPRYSDISSEYLNQVRNNRDIKFGSQIDLDETQNAFIAQYLCQGSSKQLDLVGRYNNKMHENNQDRVHKNRNIEEADYLNVKVDTQQLIQLFRDDQSLMSLASIFPQSQFRQNAKLLGMDPSHRQSIAHQLYHKNITNAGSHDYSNKYYVQFLEWKKNHAQQTRPQQTDDHQRKQAGCYKKSKDEVRDAIVRRQKQYEQYKSRLQQINKQRSEKQMRDKLRSIQQQYKMKLDNILKPKWEDQQDLTGNSRQKQFNTHKQQVNTQKKKQPDQKNTSQKAIEGLPSQNVDEGSRDSEKQKQLNQRSFVTLIRHPPKRMTEPQQYKNGHKSATDKQRQNHKEKQVKDKSEDSRGGQSGRLQFKLDIQEMVKIPYNKFILFYNTYESKIVSLCTPDQLKRVRRYRKQALERQQALTKLKSKLAASGPQILNKLSPQKKRQMFQLLYEDELQDEIEGAQQLRI